MAKIQNEQAYRAALHRIDELLPLTGDEVPRDDPRQLELEILTDLVYEYEAVHYPVERPTLPAAIRLRMYEQNLTQTKVAEMIGVSTSRMSEILTGKTDPTFSTARRICQDLHIPAAVVLGV